MGQLGDYFERLADDDRTWVLVIDPEHPELYHSLPRSRTDVNERRRREVRS